MDFKDKQIETDLTRLGTQKLNTVEIKLSKKWILKT